MFRAGELVDVIRRGVISPATIEEDRGHTVIVNVEEPIGDLRSVFPTNPPTINRTVAMRRAQVLAAGWDR